MYKPIREVRGMKENTDNNDGKYAGRYVITLGRQFGSGGMKIGKILAEILGIGFYDKGLIAMAAKRSGLSEDLFEGIDEKHTNSLLYSLVMGMQHDRHMYRSGDILNSDAVFRIQSQVIEELADRESCVIVGRCSDYVLRDHPNVINIFIHAADDYKLERIMDMYKLKEKEAFDKIKTTNKKRANYYNFYSNRKWGDVSNYHISIDSSVLGTEGSAKLLSEFVKSKFNTGM